MGGGLVLGGAGIISLLLVFFACRFFEEGRLSLDDDPLLLVVELFPQARLRNRDVDEVQIQLRHDSPGLLQILLASWERAAGVHRQGHEDVAGHPENR